MPAEFSELVLPFSACLARVSGVVAMTPVPGWKASPRELRAFLSLALTIMLFPVWPVQPVQQAPNALQWMGLLVTEVMIGLLLGCTVSFLLESFGLAAQLFGLQAGFSYASTIDPNSEADSGVLQVALQLLGGMVFLSLGLDRTVLRSLAHSFDVIPPGTAISDHFQIQRLMVLGTEMWRVAFRLALPIAVLLLLLDLTLALLNRLQGHLQLLSLAFPVKLLATLVILATLLAYVPDLTRQQARVLFEGTLPLMKQREGSN